MNGEKLTRAMAKAGLDSKGLARLTGISEEQIKNYMAGTVESPAFRKVVNVASVLAVSPYFLEDMEINTGPLTLREQAAQYGTPATLAMRVLEEAMPDLTSTLIMWASLPIAGRREIADTITLAAWHHCCDNDPLAEVLPGDWKERVKEKFRQESRGREIKQQRKQQRQNRQQLLR